MTEADWTEGDGQPDIFLMPPLDHRTILSAELNTLMRLVTADHLTISGLHDARWRLGLDEPHYTGNLATLRAQVRYAIAERLSAASGMPVTYFVDGTATPTTPDDAAGLE